MIPFIARMVAGMATRRGAAAAANAGRASARAAATKGVGSAAHERALRRQHAAERAADRNDFVAQGVTNIVDKVDEFTGGLIGVTRFSQSITVTVRGGPEASLRRCWFLCIAALFGRRRRSLEACMAEALNCQWDITGKTVSATLSYTNNVITEPGQNLTDSLSPQALLQRGPDQVTIGAGWSNHYFTAKQATFPGVNAFSAVGGLISAIARTNVVPGETGIPLASKVLNTPWVQYTLPGVEPPRVDASGFFIGWRISKVTTDNERATMPNVFVTPWVIQQALPDVLAELPTVVPMSGVESIPYTVQVPPGIRSNGVDVQLNNTRFVVRGDKFGMVPVLPDEGRVITTGEKRNPYVQPPKPPVDGVSRGNLLSMVAAQLASPGVLIESPPNLINNTQPVAAEGVFVYRPGTVYANQVDVGYRFRPASIASKTVNVPGAFLNQIVRGLYAPFAAVNIRLPKPQEPEFGGGSFNPELRG